MGRTVPHRHLGPRGREPRDRLRRHGANAWTWLLEALERHRAGYSREGGTASRVLAEGFGLLGDQEEGADVELRASWTPDGSDVAPHLAAWADTVCTFAGLPPYPRGVTVLHPRR